MGSGHDIDDREAETGARAGAGGVASAERLESPLRDLQGEARALVADVELDRPGRARARFDRNRPLPMAERVVDEVAERLFCAEAVDVQYEPVVDVGVDGATGIVSAWAEALGSAVA